MINDLGAVQMAQLTGSSPGASTDISPYSSTVAAVKRSNKPQGRRGGSAAPTLTDEVKKSFPGKGGGFGLAVLLIAGYMFSTWGAR